MALSSRAVSPFASFFAAFLGRVYPPGPVSGVTSLSLALAVVAAFALLLGSTLVSVRTPVQMSPAGLLLPRSRHPFSVASSRSPAYLSLSPSELLESCLESLELLLDRVPAKSRPCVQLPNV